MITDNLARFSIKQRLRSANHSIIQTPSRSLETTQKKIHVPEHYNYFLHTVEKEIKHQAHTFRKIKKKIDQYKSRKESRMKIKNAFQYSHQCFPTRKTIGQNFRKTVGEPFRETTNIKPNLIGSLSSQFKIDIGLKDRTLLTSAKSTSSFVRSPPITISQFAQKIDELIDDKGPLVSRGKRKLRKEGIFELTGTKPKWTTFQSYRTCYNSAVRTPL